MERLANLRSEEKIVSVRRQELHERIDTLRAKASDDGVAISPRLEEKERLENPDGSSYGKSLRARSFQVDDLHHD
jgi:hypothetical protein